MRWCQVLGLAGVLLFVVLGSASALELVRTATIPRGDGNFYQIPVGDADHDAFTELIFPQTLEPFTLNIWEHWGSNSFQPAVKPSTKCVPAAAGDVDGDGLTDLLCQWGFRVFLLESTSPTTFPSRQTWEESIGGFPGIRGYFKDTDHDGRKEMWIVPNDPDVIEVWENRGNDAYEQVAVLTDPTMNPTTLAFGDFDGDGSTEIVAGDTNSSVTVWETNGDDSWSAVWHRDYPVNWIPTVSAAAKDMDGDGKREFLLGGEILDRNDRFVDVYEAVSDNTYEPVWHLDAPGTLFQTMTVVGNVDLDPAQEFAVAAPGSIDVYKAFGNDDFRLLGQVPYSQDFAIALADLNGNGVDELIFTGPKENDQFQPTETYVYELADIQPPVLSESFYPSSYGPVAGSPVSVHFELLNRTASLQVVDVWIDVYEGDGQGGPTGRLVRQKRVLNRALLRAGAELSRDVSARAPAKKGRYTVQLKVGTFDTAVLDTKWFTVEAR